MSAVKSTAVIVTAHGRFAEGIASAIHLVVGPMPHLHIINFEEGKTPQEIDEALKKAYESEKDRDLIVVLADLKGGTPFNRAVMTLSCYNKVRILSGLNFASLYQALTADSGTIDEIIDEIVAVGREGICVYEAQSHRESEAEDDGI